jgi:hypothetical protein
LAKIEEPVRNEFIRCVDAAARRAATVVVADQPQPIPARTAKAPATGAKR